MAQPACLTLWHSLPHSIKQGCGAGGRRGHLRELLQHAGLLRARVCQPWLRPATIRQHHFRHGEASLVSSICLGDECLGDESATTTGPSPDKRWHCLQELSQVPRCAPATASTRSSAVTATLSTLGSWLLWVRYWSSRRPLLHHLNNSMHAHARAAKYTSWLQHSSHIRYDGGAPGHGRQARYGQQQPRVCR